MAEEIKKTEDLKKAEDAAAQDAQKLSDEALEQLSGGSWGDYQSNKPQPKR